MRFSNKGDRHFREPSGGGKKPMDPATMKKHQRYLIMILFNSIIFIGVYFYLNQIEFRPTFFIYLGITAVAVLAYVIYNRGFSRHGITPEMLPDTMSAVEKVEFLTSRDRRIQKSKWLLTIIIPCLFTFGIDSMVLFVIPYFERLFS